MEKSLYETFESIVRKIYVDVESLFEGEGEEREVFSLIEKAIKEHFNVDCDVIPSYEEFWVFVSKKRICLYRGRFEKTNIKTLKKMQAFLRRIEKNITQSLKMFDRILCSSLRGKVLVGCTFPEKEEEYPDFLEEFEKNGCLLVLGKQDLEEFVEVVLEVAEEVLFEKEVANESLFTFLEKKYQ